MWREIKEVGWALHWYFGEDRNTQYGPQEVRSYDEAARVLTNRQEYAEFLANHIGGAGKTLEIAAGTGLVSQALIKKTPESVFTDISDNALEILRQRLGQGAMVQKVDFHALPYPAEAFDTIVCVGGYRYVDPARKEQFWQGLERVLRPDGRIYVGQFYPRAFPLRGADISLNGINTGLQHRSLAEFRTQVRLNPGAVATGKYITMEFGKGLNEANA